MKFKSKYWQEVFAVDFKTCTVSQLYHKYLCLDNQSVIYLELDYGPPDLEAYYKQGFRDITKRIARTNGVYRS